MSLRLEINDRLYSELSTAKDFTVFLKTAKMKRNFIKTYLRHHADETNTLIPWTEFVDQKDKMKLGAMILTHGGYQGGRLALIFEINNNHLIRRLIYWDNVTEKLDKNDLYQVAA